MRTGSSGIDFIRAHFSASWNVEGDTGSHTGLHDAAEFVNEGCGFFVFVFLLSQRRAKSGV